MSKIKMALLGLIGLFAVMTAGCQCGDGTAPGGSGKAQAGEACEKHENCASSSHYCRPDPDMSVKEATLKCGNPNELNQPCRSDEECYSRICLIENPPAYGRCVNERPVSECSIGEVATCYNGKVVRSSPNVSAPCKAGETTCQKDGKWGPCVGEVVPKIEVCGNGVDEDCNGKDEVCPVNPVCQDGQTRSCWEDETSQKSLPSPCKSGVQKCVAGQWGVCENQVKPIAETCDGVDNDCNGKADDGLTRACKNACGNGNETCSAGQWGGCTASRVPPEICGNGLDDNCDGRIDEDCVCKKDETRACYSGPSNTKGISGCKAGIQACVGGLWSPQCVGEVTPQPEVCDGKDNDCDGIADNIKGTTNPLIRTCKAQCGLGTEKCENGQWNGFCVGVRQPTVEICNNGIDDDCNGQTDELSVCVCTPGTEKECGTGPCAKGKQVCKDDGKGWSPCVGEVRPSPEVCDGKDNDCNGQIDDNIPQKPCVGCNGRGFETCHFGVWGACSAPGPVAEICNNGLDDDCNGKIDDLAICTCNGKKTQSCFLGNPSQAGVGECNKGTQACSADGKIWGPCLGSGSPKPEVCDNKDNDCDGSIDEGVTRSCYGGPAGTLDKGICKVGTQVCRNGQWGLCSGETLPVKEVCNNAIDDDCNGLVDENCQCTGTEKRFCFDGDPAQANQGVCNLGSQSCVNGFWGPCTGSGKPSKEICDGKDNDCDGQVDDGCACKTGDTQACYSGPQGTKGLGTCKAGTQVCNSGVWGPCKNDVVPVQELCDGKDNDCDGKIDGMSRSCYSGPFTTKGKGTCKDGTQTCSNGSWGSCVGEIKPATETCDGKDNDCDGQVDNIPGTTTSLTQTCYTGPAGTSGVGICSSGTQTCSSGSWGACSGQVTPQISVCNGKDDNCDGKTDVGCVCTPGEFRDCYNGPANTRKVGACKDGRQKCATDGKSWGTCVGEIKPTPEQCDAIDHDCDGLLNNGVAPQSCYPPNASAARGKGLCKDGQQVCQSNGFWSQCTGFILPDTEICDGKDNDCDGSVDENLTQKCYRGPSAARGKGLCVEGSQACSNGTWSICQGDVLPTSETCDNLDNDCDGQIDNNLSRSCYSGPQGTEAFGVCKRGTQTCSAGSWGTCVGEIKPTTETCDGLDNDCDGRVDNDLTRACYTGPQGTEGKGLCKGGQQVCTAGAWGSCVGEITPTSEICDGKDNDCNGLIDDNIADRSCYGGPSGTENIGICKSGSQSCTNGAWQACTGEVRPQTEVCDGKDNDCDGSVDEGLTRACYTGPQGTQGRGICKGGAQTCTLGNWGICSGEVLPSTEVCADGLDNDCDGITDNPSSCTCTPNATRSCYTGPSGTQDVGICRGGIETCNPRGTGWGSCTGQTLPTSEVCNDGLDNNCDGQVNENCTNPPPTNSTWSVTLPSSVRSNRLACDSANNCYVSGDFSGTVVWPTTPSPQTITAAGQDCFLAKINSAGQLIQVIKFGGNGNDYCTDVSFVGTDVVVVGLTAGMTVGTFNVAAGAFAARFNTSLQVQVGARIQAGIARKVSCDASFCYVSGDSSGHWIRKLNVSNLQSVWAKTSTALGAALPVPVVAAGSFVYMADSFRGNYTCGNQQLTSITGSPGDIVVAKLNANDGSCVWAQVLGENLNLDTPWAITSDTTGNIYVTGSVSSRVAVAKFNASGTRLWLATQPPLLPNSQSSGLSIMVESTLGTVYVGGAFQGTLQIPTTPTTTLTSAGDTDGFVARLLASSGSWLKAERVATGSGREAVLGLHVFSTGDFAITASFDDGTSGEKSAKRIIK